MKRKILWAFLIIWLILTAYLLFLSNKWASAATPSYAASSAVTTDNFAELLRETLQKNPEYFTFHRGFLDSWIRRESVHTNFLVLPGSLPGQRSCGKGTIKAKKDGEKRKWNAFPRPASFEGEAPQTVFTCCRRA